MILAVQPGVLARILLGLGKTTTELQHLDIFICSLFVKHQLWNVHDSGVFSWAYVFWFNPTNKKSAFIELKVLIVKFQASTLEQCNHLLINLSCTNASKPLNAQYCTWARIHRGRRYDCACYTVFTRFWQGRIQGGGRSPHLKPTKVTLFTITLYDSENSIRDIRPFSIHCFVTTVLWSILHLSYSSELIMRLVY